METINESTVFSDGENVSELRKRTKPTERTRSISPNRIEETTSWTSRKAPLYTFQRKLKCEFPEMYFTDEFCEPESGITTCMVGGMTCDFVDIEKYNTSPFIFRFEDGRLCLTHTIGDNDDKVVISKSVSKINKKQVAIVILWLFNIGISIFFMSAFVEKYNEL